ncbi:hypothetical protein CBR_g36711 [Chara braunii]|uniref:Integrase catalytic domain-containing protein n=1 Tax=Chara braunii TaxID=69332 RepID=A0A388LLH9_CHABU|nr:hypothetical protein CBR_g36711 [Chara braunii]|eukprot:GBG83093.1 hypothetical protein CBR_g36711 [Chara braunii]
MDLARDEATYGRLRRRQHFQETEEQEESTEEERDKEGTTVLMENLLYTCNWQQRELLAMRQVFIRHETTFKALDKKILTVQAEISTLHAANSQQQTLNNQLQTDASMGLAQLSATASTGSAVVDCSPALAAQAKQLEERINHMVASLGDINKFAGASTVSNQLQTLSDRVEQQPVAAAKEWKMPNFKIEKFDDYHKTDPLQWWMAFNAEADVHHTPAHRRLDALYLQLIGGAQAFMTHMAVTLECTIANLHTKITWEEFEKKWKTRFMVNNDKRHAMNKIFHIYQGQQTSREWLMEWQRLVATPELNLPFDAIRAEFFARSCDALTAALGTEFQYETFDDLISKARELIQACEAVSFDILDTKFDMILGISWLQSEDHPVNFRRRTVHVRDRRGELVPCTVPLPHPSIGCHVVSTASIHQSIRRNDIEEMGICFLHALPPGDQPKMDTSDPRIIELLDSYEDVFQAPAGVIPDRPIRHGITLEDGVVAPRGCIYRMSEEELQVLRAQLDDLLAKGWIRPSCSPYGAPVLFVRKKNKDLRLCIDYRKLNEQTIKNVAPLPRIDDLLERPGGAKYFSKLDLKSGYHQIKIQPRDRYKTAFKTRYGHFEWIVMPFGLTNAPATFQAAMTTKFRDLLDRTVLIYLDDILVYSRTLDEHLRAVLERLRIAKYKANRDKCEFAQQELGYLGHYVTLQGVRPLTDKVQAIQDWPDLKCTTDIRSFLDLASYYMRFVKDFNVSLHHYLSSDHPPTSNYRIVDGYLLLHTRGEDLLCVPQNRILRTRLLGEYHDSRLAGHLGVARTLARLRQRFQWSDIISDINRYIQSCAVCHRNKGRHQLPYGELKPLSIPREPRLSIAMDVTGHFPRDRLGHDGILTIVDRLSKYTRFLPCKYHATAPELARLLHTGWFCSHGVPEDIVSDRDTRFMLAFWAALMVESGTSMKPSSARHPQMDGQTERAHQTAQMMLRTLIRPDQKDWVDRLPDIEFAYNTSVHPGIGVTPFELHHGGRKGRIFVDILLPWAAYINAACSPSSTRKYRELLAKARANMQKAQVRMQQQANRRRIPCPIRAGDLVWVTSEEFALKQDVSRKLLPKWFGPWMVTSAVGDDPSGPSFIIEIPPHLTVHPIFHSSKLAVYTPASAMDFLSRRSQDPPSMDGH